MYCNNFNGSISAPLCMWKYTGTISGIGGVNNESTESEAPAQEASTDESSAKSAEGMKVVYVTPGAMGDNGFCDSVGRGLDRIEADFGAQTTVIENNNDASKYAESLEACFQWQPDVVFAEPYGFEELYIQYADKYPDTTIVCLDFVLENNEKTISSYTFINEEGSFLAGVCAALVTESDLEYANEEKIVGFVGGNDITVIREFYTGFEQGVKYVDPEIEVLSTYVGDFFDPVKGKTAAKQLYAQGADIIFQAAGRTGHGVLEAANEEGKYAIGVDSNQNGVYPGHVVSSMVKDLDGAVYDTFAKIVDGSYEENVVYSKGAGPSGVYLAIDENSEKILTPEMLAQIDEVTDKIVSGEIKIERYSE